MPPTDNLPKFVDTGRVRWSNWHANFEQPLYKLYDVWNADPDRSTLEGYKGTTRGLLQVITQALEADRSVRALGGGWSMSPIAATDGVLLNTRPLNYRFPLGPGEITPNYPGNARLFFVQCGITIATLNSYLAGKGLALRTSGASNGQTIAGALSTGTHGAALSVGSVPDYVVALHLVTGAGKSVWLERKSYPVIHPDIPARLEAEFLPDDTLFDAAVVSFGSFGIIHGVVIETDPLYYLNTWRKRVTLDDALWEAIRSLQFDGVNLPGAQGRTPHHVQFVMNPFDGGVPRPVATLMYRAASFVPGAKQADPYAGAGPGDAGLEMIGKLTDWQGDATAALSKLTTKFLYKESENLCGTPGQTFKDTTTRGHGASAAMGVPLDRAREAWEVASAQVVAVKAPALISLRLVKSGRATLGFIRHGTVTAVLEVDGPDSSRVRQAYRGIWQALDAAGIAYTFHWGKLNNLDAAVVRRMYQAAVQPWMDARRRLLPTAELRRVFANDFTNQLQLSD